MNRRHFLSATTAGLLSGALPATRVHAAAGSSQPGDSPEARLARFALAIRHDTLPPEVIASAKRVVLDTLGCALAAFGTDAATIAEQTIRDTYGHGTAATVIGHAERATLEGAIFVNGVLVRSLDLNDTYIGTDPLHPSELLPIALAAAEAAKLSGRQFIEALVAGYEASTRVNDALSFMDRGFHPLCAMSYAAPVILGKLWNLPEAAIGHAIGLSAARGYTSFVINSGAISMMKAMGFAATAADVVLMARLAARGFTGPTGTLEWAATRFKPGAPKPVLDLEPTGYRLPKVAFKRFPVQIELQAVVEAGVLLSRRIGARAAEIREIRVLTYPGVIQRVADPAKFRPETKGTADHSLPVCLAMALLDGNVSVAQFEADRWRAGEVMGLVARTAVAPGADLMARRPKGRGCSVEILFHDGTTDRETVEVAEGDAERPVSAASLLQKFMSFAAPVVGEVQAQRIAATVERLETLDTMEELASALRPHPG